MAFVFSFVLDSAGILIIDPSIYIYISLTKKNALESRVTSSCIHIPLALSPLHLAAAPSFLQFCSTFRWFQQVEMVIYTMSTPKKGMQRPSFQELPAVHPFRWVTFLQDESAGTLPSFCVVQKNSVTTVRGEGYMKVPTVPSNTKTPKVATEGGVFPPERMLFSPLDDKARILELAAKAEIQIELMGGRECWNLPPKNTRIKSISTIKSKLTTFPKPMHPYHETSDLAWMVHMNPVSIESF